MKFGEDLTKEIQSLLCGENVFAVTDDNVFALYGELFDRRRTFVFGHGEDQKHLGTVEEICTFLLKSGANRHSRIVAVGGGVVGDIAGFCAAVYMRGIHWVNVPTTLLAQCDSAVGGKTGVDLGQFKNIIGAFHAPDDIYFSTHFLKTLPPREYRSGIGELLKTAALSEEIFSFYSDNQHKIQANDGQALQAVIRLCAEFKDSVVTRDPHEKTGLRKILNYGHTAGHALEAADCHKLSHGEYVLYGMLIENRMCKESLDPAYFATCERLILSVLGDTHLQASAAEAVDAASADKKNESGKISVIAVLKPGQTKEMWFTKEAFSRAFLAAYINN